MRRPRAGRTLAPAEQLRVLGRIWRANRDGYVFLPWITGDSETREQRRKNYHEGRAFLWPRERDAILSHLQSHQEDDLYFCPNLFNGKRRQEELVYAEMSLYADLDEVDPRTLRRDRRPTVAWETSPGRFQGAWLLGGMREGATWPGRENQRLTYELGADLSGWDATQLLRVPGKPNHKPEYRGRNGGDAVPGVLLWDSGPRYQWDDFDDLPEIGVVDGADYDLMDEELLASVDRHETWSRVRMSCSAAVRRYMAVRSSAEVGDVDRSDVLWQIERDLADAGCTLAEIVAVVRPTAWNKFRDRNDEIRRLKTEAAKAIAAAREEGALEAPETAKPRKLTTVQEFWARDVPRVRWLVKDVWPEGGCGFIAGPPKTYKSWMALDLAVSLATGTPFLGDPRFPVVGRPRRVAYLQQEDSESLMRDRLGTVLDGRSPPHHPSGHLSWQRETGRGLDVLTWDPPTPMPMWLEVRCGLVLSDEGWQSWLDEMMGENRLEVLVVDTLFTSAGDVDLDKAQETMTRMLRPLSTLADKHGCAVVVVHHNKKDAYAGKMDDDVLSHLGARAGRDMLGSVSMHAWVDTALYVRARQHVDRVVGASLEGPDGVLTGVPGTEVFVERESKLAEEMRIRVGIPRMSRRGVGGVPTWMPQVEIGWRREVEGENGAGRGGESGGNRRRNGDGRGGGGRARAPGELIVERMAEMGVTTERGRTVAEIAHVLDVAERGVARQLRAAADRGRAAVRNDLWYLAEKDADKNAEREG